MKASEYIENARKITCREAQNMIPGYLDGTLSDRDLAAFLHHVDNCNKCYEELETNFMVDRTVKYLNEEEMGSCNLRPLLAADIREKKSRLIRKRRMRKLRAVIILITLILIALLVLDLTGVFHITLVLRGLAA